MASISDATRDKFRQTVWRHYRAYQRSMPWREDPNPYWVLVSEVMLQQTQVERVLPKFAAFIECFATVEELAGAPLAEVLRLWSGLGYNRRAKSLHQAAQMIVDEHHGQVPSTLAELCALPAIGKHTAGAIMAYAFNTPVVFIETNIRSVYFHHFFNGRVGVEDSELHPLIELTLDRTNPREWYWALMDYGTYLKRTHGNNIARSRHYKKQSTFEGSRRQLRGRVLKALLDGPRTAHNFGDDKRLDEVIEQLVREGFVERRGERLMLRV